MMGGFLKKMSQQTKEKTKSWPGPSWSPYPAPFGTQRGNPAHSVLPTPTVFPGISEHCSTLIGDPSPFAHFTCGICTTAATEMRNISTPWMPAYSRERERGREYGCVCACLRMCACVYACEDTAARRGVEHELPTRVLFRRKKREKRKRGEGNKNQYRTLYPAFFNLAKSRVLNAKLLCRALDLLDAILKLFGQVSFWVGRVCTVYHCNGPRLVCASWRY